MKKKKKNKKDEYNKGFDEGYDKGWEQGKIANEVILSGNPLSRFFLNLSKKISNWKMKKSTES